MLYLNGFEFWPHFSCYEFCETAGSVSAADVDAIYKRTEVTSR